MNFLKFLTLLGLDEHADLSAIRRAYARQLKQIDQEHDPEAFARLRNAYEAAQEWLSQNDARANPAAPLATQSEAANSWPILEASVGEPAISLSEALYRAHHQLKEALQTPPGVDFPAQLENIVDQLCNVAPELYEPFVWQLLDFLASQRTPHRFEVFDAATQLFQLRHMPTNPPDPGIALWLEATSSELAAWAKQPKHVRESQLAILREVQKEAVSAEHWSELEALFECYPHTCLLVVDSDKVTNWRYAMAQANPALRRGQPAPLGLLGRLRRASHRGEANIREFMFLMMICTGVAMYLLVKIAEWISKLAN
ncbi:J domain-containing protein [Pinirhizobacter soli]|uniref:J domain-containing protein n=1 Tax=Pinirhizobacter soli TaxID=2786953 RepID=UPI00202AAFBF|nr:J domain-containing protein [Pinirhizobacter soli]